MDGNGCERETARHRRSRRAGGDSGAALVEMALMVPILGLFLFGIITFGYLMSFRGGLAQGAAEGARAAATSPRSPSTVPGDRALLATNQALSNYGKTCNFGATTCTFVIAPCTGVGASGDCMTVTVRYNNAIDPVIPEVPIISYAIPDTLVVSSTVKLNNV
jgi:hypothetical protein